MIVTSFAVHLYGRHRYWDYIILPQCNQEIDELSIPKTSVTILLTEITLSKQAEVAKNWADRSPIDIYSDANIAREHEPSSPRYSEGSWSKSSSAARSDEGDD